MSARSANTPVPEALDDYYELLQVPGGLGYIKDIESTIVIGEIMPDKEGPILD